MRRLLILIVVIAGTPLAAFAQVAAHPRVQEATHLLGKWLDSERAYRRIPGLSAAVVLDQEVVWSGASGHADLAAMRPAAPTTIYSICSISKLFTSIALMQLRDQGKLRLDDPVSKHLPWYSIKRSHAQAGDATLEGLLTHASGLPREAAFPYWSAPEFAFPTREQIVQALSSQETLYPTETYFQYSNLGLTLAGEVVTAASGQPYADYVRHNILQPLGLASTFPDMPESERGARLATGYGAWPREGERRPLPFFQTRGIAPAAGYASTALDLARFASWQFRLLQYRSKEVLDPNTLREMHRIHFVDPGFETNWGLGFSVWRSDGKTFVGHGGSCPGYRTQLLLQTDEKIATVVMTNGIDVNASALAQRAYDIMAPALKSASPDSTPPKPAEKDLDRYLGTYAASFGGEIEVLVWQGSLGTLNLPTENPVRGITKLRRVGEHLFKRVRSDGELAETWTFEVGPDGRAARVRFNYNLAPRIR
jgi:CubicO group peptidase (beta-lactamase class C family)